MEEAFRTLKGDLGLRPIYHHKPERIQAHLFVAFLAYCLSITLRQRLKALAGGLMPRVVFEKLATLQLLDVRVPTTAAVFASKEAAQLKLISRWGVGYDSIDVPAATKEGIVIAYTPGLLNDAVADYAMALLFALARRVHEGHLSMREGKWASGWGHDIGGKTLGIIGCGRIGQAVARRASGFNMRLLGYDIASCADAEKLGVQRVPLDQLLAESDFISLHCALTPETRGLIGEAQLRKMKPSAYIINTARGAVMDEAALLRALKEKWIAGAALDAFVVEPLPADHPFRTAPNLLLTPHQASFGFDTGARVSEAAAQAIVDFQAGRKPQWVVNPEVYSSPTLRSKIHG